ncbi:beta-propeller fold lactonase family protein, partial [Staphylococcus epidermidis]|uniref:beta-propeller fold lactonase family protein n=1 Tax=Staphylococcus epidermidis TaxID=1282 RepID=UPI0011A35A4B
HDTIPIFQLLEHARSLRSIQIQPTYHPFPTHFNITQSHNYLISPHQQPQSKLSIFQPHNITPKLSLKHKKPIPNQPLSLLL